MSSLSSFGPPAYVKRLKEADVPEKQAEAQAEALRTALDTQDVASKSDIALVLKDLLNLEQRIDTRFVQIAGKLTWLHWMLGITLAGVDAIFAKLFLG